MKERVKEQLDTTKRTTTIKRLKSGREGGEKNFFFLFFFT